MQKPVRARMTDGTMSPVRTLPVSSCPTTEIERENVGNTVLSRAIAVSCQAPIATARPSQPTP
jgi:hypothetical protein